MTSAVAWAVSTDKRQQRAGAQQDKDAGGHSLQAAEQSQRQPDNTLLTAQLTQSLIEGSAGTRVSAQRKGRYEALAR